MKIQFAAMALVSMVGLKTMGSEPMPNEFEDLPAAGGGKMLVVYFSHTGNTRAIARQIQAATGADLLELVPADPYPERYGDVLARARKELQDGVLPELKSEAPDLAPYKVIFVGSPNWLNTIVPPVMAFLAGRDFSGKTLVPFMTHGGGGLGNSRPDLTRLAPAATLLEGRAFLGDTVADAGEDVRTWLQGLDLSR